MVYRVVEFMNYDIGAITDVGNKRKINQDSVLCVKRENVAMIAVADGMGGLKSGEIVSKMVIQGLLDWWNRIQSFDNMERSLIKNSLSDEIINLNIKVIRYCQNSNIQSGTTLTMALIVRDICYYIYSGDTRLYLLRDDTVYQLSYDENLYAYMKQISPNENSDKNKSILLSYIGKGKNLPLNIDDISITKKDILVICSDGFYNYLDFSKKENISLFINSNSQLAAEKMRDIVKTQAAHDNLSIVIVKYK